MASFPASYNARCTILNIPPIMAEDSTIKDSQQLARPSCKTNGLETFKGNCLVCNRISHCPLSLVEYLFSHTSYPCSNQAGAIFTTPSLTRWSGAPWKYVGPTHHCLLFLSSFNLGSSSCNIFHIMSYIVQNDVTWLAAGMLTLQLIDRAPGKYQVTAFPETSVMIKGNSYSQSSSYIGGNLLANLVSMVVFQLVFRVDNSAAYASTAHNVDTNIVNIS